MIHRFVDLIVVEVCSPPFSAYNQGAVFAESPNVFRSCPSDAPGDLTQVTDFDDFSLADACHNPVLSPDGSKILFEVEGPFAANRQIWVVDSAPGSTATQLVADASNQVVHPSWGADSDTFVYVHCSGGALQEGTIFKDTVSSPGSPTALKSGSGFSPWRPRFNHDGTRIAYIYAPVSAGDADLRCMDDDGSNDSSLDNTLDGYLFQFPPQFGWANNANMIAYSDGETARNTYVINDDGSGKTQLDANGDAAGSATNLSHLCFAPDDSFVVISSNIGAGYITMFRAEVDGSDTTALGSTGAINQTYMTVGVVFNNRIWFISGASSVSTAKLRSMALDGTDQVENFNNTLGPGNLIADFTSGDGFYFS